MGRIDSTVSLVVVCCALGAGLPSVGQEAPVDSGTVVYLNQGWTDEDRLTYYYTSQGSAVMPYDIFLYLEEAGSTNLLRSDKVSDSYGLTPMPADPKFNPDGLPVGVTKASVPDGRWKGDWVGLTCAACHNGEVFYKGKRIRIEGGVSKFDIMGYVAGLDDALKATLADPDKFGRMATGMGKTDEAAKSELRGYLETAATSLDYYRNISVVSESPAGPGRIDALGAIHNRLADILMGIPQNWKPAMAAAKYPFVFNASASSWVQWTGVAAKPLARNMGEIPGVYGRIDLTSATPEDGLFDSTIDAAGLIKIEETLRKLAPPKWPEEIFGPIDQTKASAGRALFVENCSECHSVYPHRWSDPKLEGKRFIENALVPLDIIGTDPQMFDSPQFADRPTDLTGVLAPYLPAPYTDALVAPYGDISKAVNSNVTAKLLAQLNLSPEALLDATGYRDPKEAPPVQPVFKASPRDGTWAIGPYLHNASVPNLYELLSPAAERSKTFFVGREFDPVKVGIDTTGASGKFLFDTALVGNSNQGHSFQDGPMTTGVIGRLLTEPERWEVIEYLKSIPTEDAQVTPFGGPPDPVEAWTDSTFFNYNHSAIYSGD